MKLLEKENWWIWFVLALFTGGSSALILGALLDVFNKEAWYYRWVKKLPKPVMIFILALLAVSFLIMPLLLSFAFTEDISKLDTTLIGITTIFLLVYLVISIMIIVFQIQILAQTNAKLKTPGSEIYLSPYIWILGLIIPVIGWILLIVMYLYLQIWYLVMLYRGKGVKAVK